MEDNQKLTDEDLEEVSGGYIYKRINPFTKYKYEVVDDTTGKTVGYYQTLEKAQDVAHLKNQSDEKINFFQRMILKKLGKKKQVKKGE